MTLYGSYDQGMCDGTLVPVEVIAQVRSSEPSIPQHVAKLRIEQFRSVGVQRSVWLGVELRLTRQQQGSSP